MNDFEKLKVKWYKKLADSGFKDIEYSNGSLYQHNLRTIGWDNRDRIRDFFLKLDSYLANSPDIPFKHKKLLMLWSKGKSFTYIAENVELSVSHVKKLVSNYKQLIVSGEINNE